MDHALMHAGCTLARVGRRVALTAVGAILALVPRAVSAQPLAPTFQLTTGDHGARILGAIGDSVLFVRYDPITDGYALGRSDGTVAGTSLLAPTGGWVEEFPHDTRLSERPRRHLVRDGRLYFVGN